MTQRQYLIVMFDWGDTLMVDDPTLTAPMVEWAEVRAVEGAEALLRYLKTSGRRIMLATSADVSDETQIRAALARVGLGEYFERIYSFKNTGLPKGEALYGLILDDLNVEADQVIMIGDSFEKDVLAANQRGVRGIWFNARNAETRSGALYMTIHTLNDLRLYFQTLDTDG